MINVDTELGYPSSNILDLLHDSRLFVIIGEYELHNAIQKTKQILSFHWCHPQHVSKARPGNRTIMARS